VLRDPRLDLGGCTTSEGDPVAFAWVQPSQEARYVVVAQRGFGELYETSDGLAVRISSTAQVDLQRSRATFRVSEHAGDGRRLLVYELEASVSG
jgi:hypothetical protein